MLSANSVMFPMSLASRVRTICSTSAFPSPCPWNSVSTTTSQMVALKAWSLVALARPTSLRLVPSGVDASA